MKKIKQTFWEYWVRPWHPVQNMRKGKPYLKKHDRIVKDYDKQKSKHLEKLTDKMLKNDEKAEKLKSKPIKGNFLKNF